MFKFQDLIVGTESHEKLLSKLGDLSAQGKAVTYEEYVLEQEKITDTTRYSKNTGTSEVVKLPRRDVRCRGEAQTK